MSLQFGRRSVKQWIGNRRSNMHRESLIFDMEFKYKDG